MKKEFDQRKPSCKAYYDFLNSALSKIRHITDTKQQKKAVHRLLEDNLDKLDDNFPQMLRSWARGKLLTVDREEAQRIARNLNNFCNHIAQFPKIKPENKWEIVITGYEEATEVLTSESSPQEWLTLQNGLGIAYRNQGWIDKAITTLESALERYSLDVFRSKFPYEWANIQDSLGNAYHRRSEIQEDKQQELHDVDLALTCYKEALRNTSKHKFYEWAQTKQNLCCVYCKLGKTAEAITCYKQVLEVYTEETFPHEWAQIQHNLGLAYSYQNNIDEAIDCFRLALKILTPTVYPEHCFQTGRDFGNVAFKANRWQEAIEGYGIAIEAVEQQRCIWAKTDSQRQKIQEEAIHVYICIVKACINNGQITKAIEYVERSKARNLVEHLTSLNLDPKGVSKDKQGKGILFQEIEALLPDKKTALIEWYILDDIFVAFIINHQSPGISIWQSSPKDLEDFTSWWNEYLQDYDSRKAWRDCLASRLNRLAEILHLDEILTHVPDTCDRITLIPHQRLHVLPLHALPLPNEKGKCLLDKFPRGVNYAPSCQVLQLAQGRKRPDFTHLFAIQNPTEDLKYSDIEVQAIKEYFHSKHILVKGDATKSAIIDNQQLQSAHLVHFSCHGRFKFDKPLKSALHLADCKIVLAEIFNLDLSQCRLVTLSACETGFSDILSVTDEYIGFTYAFLVSGTASIVCSLWRVNDLSTALLMIQFYQNLKSGLTVPIALNAAQVWLRDVTTEQLQQWAKQLPNANHRRQLKVYLSKQSPNTKPFESPYHWAAFCAIGQ
ncbi:MAG TPA: hypothetical protein DDZ80_15695 [Cyanobacteria bacterium UBA8803]|nr:hypothetical protein [Cyanobacteria bacterium UBA9273]HBL59860.1 hypothetical protein [Cyanobacteria bacterium UBA8803]